MASLLPDTGTMTLYHGVSAEARAALVTTLAKERAKQTSVLLVTDPRRAQELATEADTYAQWIAPKVALEVLHFPETPPPDIDPTRRTDRICERLTVLSALLRPSQSARLIVATPEAILGACPDRTHFEGRQLKLRTGEEHPFKDLIDTLIHTLDYDSEALCEHPGQLASRGGLIDIYPYDANQPYRLDFFGDEIESIRTFDPSSQRTLENVASITISAAESAKEAEAADGKFIDYLADESIAWLFEEPSQLVREHPYRFEKLSSTSGTHPLFWAGLCKLRAAQPMTSGSVFAQWIQIPRCSMQPHASNSPPNRPPTTATIPTPCKSAMIASNLSRAPAPSLKSCIADWSKERQTHTLLRHRQ